MKYCKKCDTKNPDNAAKCLVCGGSVFITQEELEQAAKVILESAKQAAKEPSLFEGIASWFKK